MSKEESFPMLEEARKNVVNKLSEYKRKQANDATSTIALLRIIACELIEINSKLKP